MFAKWLWWATYGLAGLAILFMLSAFVSAITRSRQVQEPPFDLESKLNKKPLLRYAFTLDQALYDAIGSPVLETIIRPPSPQLPDLQPVLTYYGTNSRPDAAPGQTRLQFGLTGRPAYASVAPSEPLYFLYDRSQLPGKYIFSPKNAPTGLWIEAVNRENDAWIKVQLKDDQGKLITEPRQRAEFALPEKEMVRIGGTSWEIGKMKVDGTLLARQRARWYGGDEFMNAHGGTEYAAFAQKERLEFGEGDDHYTVYLGMEECLIWDGKRWTPARSVPDSKPYPLLCIKKIEDRLLRLELWDVEGKGKMGLNLLKSTEAWAPQVISRDFKFISVRTLSQYVFDIRKERTILRPNDWLLLTKEGWKKIVTASEIDDYVEGRTPGVLFVFQGVVKKGEDEVLSGVLYSTNRAATEAVEIPFDHGGSVLKTQPKKAESHEEEESEEETELSPPPSPSTLKPPEKRPPASTSGARHV